MFFLLFGFYFFFPRWFLVRVRVKDGRGEAELSVVGHLWTRAQEKYTLDISICRRDCSEGGKEAVHVPAGVTCVTKKHFFLSKDLFQIGHFLSSEREMAEEEIRQYLRVEFLLKTDSGYLKDTGVSLEAIYLTLVSRDFQKNKKSCLKGSYNPPDRNDLEFLCTKHRWKRNPPQYWQQIQ